MKAIKCEMCNSNDLVKIDGLYVCQNCGTKYSVDEARKMMYDLDVTEDGKVKVDNTEEIHNLLQLARKAKESNNFPDAEKYYNAALMKAPSNWEAYFYSSYCNIFNADDSRINELIDIYRKSVANTLDLINSSMENDIGRDRAILEVSNKTVVLCSNLCRRADSFYKDKNLGISKEVMYNKNVSTFGALSSMNEQARNRLNAKEVKKRVCAVLYNTGDYIAERFKADKNISKIIVVAWGNANALAKKYGVYDTDLGTYYDNKIEKYNSVRESKERYCPNCGTQFSEQASYCKECGKKLK